MDNCGTDGLTSLDRYKGRCYHIEVVVGEEENQYIAYVAYPLDLFEEGYFTNMLTSIVGNVFGFKALRALRLEDLRIPPSYSKTFQGHYLNATAGTCEEMIKRAVFARELGVPIIMHDYLTGGFTANTSLAHYCRDNGLLLHIHRAMHAVLYRQKNHGMHFRVLAKALRMSGGDHIHAGTVVGKLEGEREMTLGFVDLLRDDFLEKDRSRGLFFISLKTGSLCQFGGGTLGHPWGNAPGAVANRVALEACVQARNEGRDLAREGNDILREASKWSPELADACEVWKEITFDFDPVDKLDKETK
ncbi:hypothetical protein IEQ34_024864 [Dendrobium chrysotoxum]|uniref:Ribulose bisphosphate carboxylase large chain n=1 Tax=Dendrobium chrysotoxum TaxID=161865 RepID=A0AAV7FRC0_DENCH|nr:hypothetical protein IEQ34_024864 [Dendrobium chrysotoxum]